MSPEEPEEGELVSSDDGRPKINNDQNPVRKNKEPMMIGEERKTNWTNNNNSNLLRPPPPPPPPPHSSSSSSPISRPSPSAHRKRVPNINHQHLTVARKSSSPSPSPSSSSSAMQPSAYSLNQNNSSSSRPSPSTVFSPRPNQVLSPNNNSNNISQNHSSQPRHQLTYPLPPKPSVVTMSSSVPQHQSSSSSSSSHPNGTHPHPLDLPPADRRPYWNGGYHGRPLQPPNNHHHHQHHHHHHHHHHSHNPYSSSSSSSNNHPQNFHNQNPYNSHSDRRSGDRSRSGFRRHQEYPGRYQNDDQSPSARYLDRPPPSRSRQPDPYHYRAQALRNARSPSRTQNFDQGSISPNHPTPPAKPPMARLYSQSSHSPRDPSIRSSASPRKRSPGSTVSPRARPTRSPERLSRFRSRSPRPNHSTAGSTSHHRPRSPSPLKSPLAPRSQSRSRSRSPPQSRSQPRSLRRSPVSLKCPNSDHSRNRSALLEDPHVLIGRNASERPKAHSTTPRKSPGSDSETRDDMSIGTTDNSTAASPAVDSKKDLADQQDDPENLKSPRKAVIPHDSSQVQGLLSGAQSSSNLPGPNSVYDPKTMYENYQPKFFFHDSSHLSEISKALDTAGFEKFPETGPSGGPVQGRDSGSKKVFVGVSSIRSYELLEKLGEGTFGEVYKGVYRGRQYARKQKVDALTDPTRVNHNGFEDESSDDDSDVDDTMVELQSQVRLGMVVALKRIIVHNELDGLPITAIREIRILKSLDHPNIVPVLDIAFSKGSRSELRRGNTYMIFPYIDHDLAGLMENKNITFNVSQIKLYSKQLLMGTAYLHRNKILHRDLKAANLLISNAGQLMIADFGLARSIEQQHNTRKREYTNCVVTRWYRPPEILLGNRRYGTPVDLWGVGCVIGEMFKGGPILTGNSDVNQCELIFRLCGSPTAESMPGWETLPGCDGVRSWISKPRRVREEYERISPELADLMDKLLVLDPSKRLTAEDALDHDWFWTDPMPNDPAKLPHYDSSHEYDRRKKDEVVPKSQKQQFASFLGLSVSRPSVLPRPSGPLPSQPVQLAQAINKAPQQNGAPLPPSQQNSTVRIAQGPMDVAMGHPRELAPPAASNINYNTHPGNPTMAPDGRGFGGRHGRRETSQIQAESSGRSMIPNPRHPLSASSLPNGASYPPTDGSHPMGIQPINGPFQVAQRLASGYSQPQASLPMRPIGSYNSQGVYEGVTDPNQLAMPGVPVPGMPPPPPHGGYLPRPPSHFMGGPPVPNNHLPNGGLSRQGHSHNSYQKNHPPGGSQSGGRYSGQQHGYGPPYPSNRQEGGGRGNNNSRPNRDRWGGLGNGGGGGRIRRNNYRAGGSSNDLNRNSRRDSRDRNVNGFNNGDGFNNGWDNNGDEFNNDGNGDVNGSKNSYEPSLSY